MKYQYVHDQISDESQSALRRYQKVIVGSDSLFYTLKYELVTSLFGNFPGALGLWLRRKFYRGLFREAGRGTVIGKGTIIHHPQKISFGKSVAISYDCLIDARGQRNQGIFLGNNVIIGRSSAVVCKEGDIRIGNNVGLGSNSTISATMGNRVEIADNVLLAPYVYIGGVSYNMDQTDVSLKVQGADPKGGVTVGENSWLGVGVTVLDGVTIGRDCIVGARAVVTQDLPDYSISLGVPARVIRYRKETIPELS